VIYVQLYFYFRQYSLLFGVLALISLGFKYKKEGSSNKYRNIEILLSILGIFIGGYLGLLIYGDATSL